MERIKLAGVRNIVRFNWHFYALAFTISVILLVGRNFLSDNFSFIPLIIAILIVTSILVSLVVSAYIYDFSELYSFIWLNEHGITPGNKLVNIHAGFDETSYLLVKAYPNSNLSVFDFYDAEKHTEISIERARRAYPPFPGTVKITTGNIPLPEKSVDTILLTLAAHEIRNDDERTLFLKILRKTLKPEGNIVVAEHLRDLNNFLAFNIGFMHFLPRKTWLKNFEEAGLKVHRESKLTPFLSVFILATNGAAS